MLWIKAAVMGVVEGLTEFLPISSTGHLILTGSLLGLSGDTVKVFEIAIQTGAMAAVIWEYRRKLASTVTGLGSDPMARRFTVNLMIAFFPAVVLGLLFADLIEHWLFNPITVSAAAHRSNAPWLAAMAMPSTTGTIVAVRNGSRVERNARNPNDSRGRTGVPRSAESASKYRRERGTDRSEYSKNGVSASSQPQADRPASVRTGSIASGRMPVVTRPQTVTWRRSSYATPVG